MIAFTRELLNGVSRLAIRALGGPALPYAPPVALTDRLELVQRSGGLAIQRARIPVRKWTERDEQTFLTIIGGPSTCNAASLDVEDT